MWWLGGWLRRLSGWNGLAGTQVDVNGLSFSDFRDVAVGQSMSPWNTSRCWSPSGATFILSSRRSSKNDLTLLASLLLKNWGSVGYIYGSLDVVHHNFSTRHIRFYRSHLNFPRFLIYSDKKLANSLSLDLISYYKVIQARLYKFLRDMELPAGDIRLRWEYKS